MNPSSEDRDPLELLADEFLERRRTGQSPTVGEYVDRYPHLADQIRDVFPALELMEEADPGTVDITMALVDTIADTTPPELRRLGDYRILREIGRGAMGVVYEAEQESLGRRVALKILPTNIAANENAWARFHSEARAAARLHHTNIVPVFEVGQEGETAFYAMQLIQGHSLDQVLIELRRLGQDAQVSTGGRLSETDARTAALSLYSGRFVDRKFGSPGADRESDGPLAIDGTTRVQAAAVQPPPTDSASSLLSTDDSSSVAAGRGAYFRSIARIGEQAASALDYSHERGTIHRDIKPSNLLLDASGIVWVADFGLAKFEDDGHTKTGDIVGTLRYMSPERFQGTYDARSDIYSLGVTLYELLLLRPAFESSDQLKLIEDIGNVQPRRPRTLDSRIPRDLDTIVLKAMEKEPSRRYQSAREMAEDLRRFLGDEPIRARRVSLPERFVRWGRHNRAVAALSSAVFLLLAVAAVASVVAAANNHQKNLQLTEQKDELSHSLYVADIAVAEQAIGDNNCQRAVSILKRYIPAPNEPDLRGFDWHYLWRVCHPSRRVAVLDTPFEVSSVTFPDDGHTLAVQHRNGSVAVWDVADQSLKQAFRSHEQEILYSPIQASPQSGLLACLSRNGRGVVLRHQDGTETMLTGSGRPIHGLAFSPDGALLATRCEGVLDVHDLSTGTILHSLPCSAGARGYRVAFSPDGEMLAAVQRNWSITIWDPVSGLELKTLRAKRLSRGVPRMANENFEPWSLAFSPNGKVLAMGGGDSTVRLFDVESWEETAILAAHEDEVRVIAFSPDGKLLASAGRDAAVKLWDMSTHQVRETLVGHSSSVHGLDFSGDGSLLASGGADERVIVWDMSPRAEAHKFETGRFVWDLAFTTRDGPMAVLIHDVANDRDDWFVQLWDWQDTPNMLRRLPLDERPICLDASETGKLAVAFSDGEVHIEDTLDERPGKVLSVNHRICLTAISRDGRSLAVGSKDGNVEVFNLETSTKLWQRRLHKAEVTCLVFSPDDGQMLASTDASGRVILSGRSSGEPQRSFQGDDSACRFVSFSHDGKMLAAGGDDGAIRLLDLADDSKMEPRILPAHNNIYSAPFSKSGNELVTGGWDSKIRVWDLKTFRQRLVIDVGNRRARNVQFSPDESLLAWHADGNLYVVRIGPMATPAGSVAPPQNTTLQDLNRSLKLELHGKRLAIHGFPDDAAEAYTEALALRPSDPYTLILRGDLYASQERWQAAFADYDRAAKTYPHELQTLSRRAVLAVATGNLELHRKYCQDLLDSFGEQNAIDPTPFLLVPGAVDDLAQITSWAENLDDEGRSPAQVAWDDLTLHLARYRNGQYERVVTELVEPREESGELGESAAHRHVLGSFLLAMAYHQLDKQDEAREWLQSAVTLMDSEFPKTSSRYIRVRFARRIRCLALRREAEQLILGSE